MKMTTCLIMQLPMYIFNHFEIKSYENVCLFNYATNLGRTTNKYYYFI